MAKAKYPEHEKLASVVNQSQTIGAFLDGLHDLGLELGKWFRYEGRSEDSFIPANEPIGSVLARYFEIDEVKLEKEKRKMVEEIRQANEPR